MNSTANHDPAVSVVIPVFNEEKNLPLLWQRLRPVLEGFQVPYEVIFIDDGSKDASFRVLSEIRCSHPEVCLVRLRRNYGQHPATIAGFENARGRWVLTLDADLQNDPNDLRAIFKKLQEGYDVVSGVRTDRKDAFLRRKLPSRFINHFIAQRTGFVQTDTGCFLKGYTLKAAQEIAEFTDIGGFITATISVLGFKYTEVPVEHSERAHGVSRYGILMQFDQFMSLFTGYARRPFQVVELVGLLLILVGLGVALAALLQCFAPNGVLSGLLGLILMALGLILGSIGIVGEYAVRIFKLSRRSPRYLIAEIVR